jgi:hypothetical protein
MTPEIIVLKRGGGKTTELIKLCARYKHPLIVCNNKQMCEWTFKHARDMGFDIPMPITYDDLVYNTYRGQNIDAFFLDNAELFLQSLTSVPIVAIAMSEEEPKI